MENISLKCCENDVTSSSLTIVFPLTNVPHTSLQKQLIPQECYYLKIFGRNHGHETNGVIVTEKIVGPSSYRTHAFNSGDTIVGYKDLQLK